LPERYLNRYALYSRLPCKPRLLLFAATILPRSSESQKKNGAENGADKEGIVQKIDNPSRSVPMK